MSKVISAINAMLNHTDLISNIIKADHEFYFLYKKKYVWSISQDDDGDCFFVYYPSAESAKQAAAKYSQTSEGDYVVYNTLDFPSKESKATFRALYNLVKEKHLGIDEVFEDIISDDENF